MMVSNKDPLLSPMLLATSMLISERYSFIQLLYPIVQSYARRDQCLWRAKGLYAPQFGRYLHHRNDLSQWTQRTAQRQVVCDCPIHCPSRMLPPLLQIHRAPTRSSTTPSLRMATITFASERLSICSVIL